MIKLEEAVEIVLEQTKQIGCERLSLLSCLGRVLCEDVYAPEDIPGFRRSAMDGYAVKAQDTKAADKGRPAILEVVADLPAGQSFEGLIQSGQALRIMTGAPMPAGADAVVMAEDSQTQSFDATSQPAMAGQIQPSRPVTSEKKEKSQKVLIFREVKPQENVGEKGEDLKKDELVLQKGRLLKAADIGMLAAIGITVVSVSRRPKVAIISTGDEVVEIDQPLQTGQVRDSNSYALSSLVLENGGVPVRLGIARDRESELKRRLQQARDADAILFSGGVSVGDYDLVKDVLISAGVQTKFWKVAMKPGKPTFFGKWDERLVFGLPGYPASSMIVFEELVRPALWKMQARTDYFKKVYEAELKEQFRQKGGRQNFVRAKVEFEGGRFFATPLKQQKSGVLSSMVKAEGIIVVPEDVEYLSAGEKVKIKFI